MANTRGAFEVPKEQMKNANKHGEMEFGGGIFPGRHCRVLRGPRRGCRGQKYRAVME